MEGIRVPKKVLKAKFGGLISVGKLGKIWEGCCQIFALSQLEAGS
jgi:hypothetical protein